MKKMFKQCAISLANQLGPHRFAGFSRAPKLWILMYHRILPKDDIRYDLEEPGMIVTPDTFAMHLRELKLHFDVMDLDEWLTLRKMGKSLPKRACAITFDDGWQDNYEYAFPVIQQHQTPITLFTVVEKIATDFQFWPNLISALLASNATNAMLSDPLFASVIQRIPKPANANNREYMAEFIKTLKQFSDAQIFSALENINWKKHLTFELPRGLMTWEEIRAMTNSGLVKIGSHTCNHKRLNADLSSAELTHEIVDSKKILFEKMAESSNIFCFPNGDYHDQALNAVTSTYAAAVTTKRGIVNKSTSAHQLCRIGLHEHVSSTPRLLGARLSGWI